MKILLLACLLSTGSLADDVNEQDKPSQNTNCKLTIKTTLKDSSESVDIKEVKVADKAACQKLMTKAQQFTDDNIKQVNVEMSFQKSSSP